MFAKSGELLELFVPYPLLGEVIPSLSLRPTPAPCGTGGGPQPLALLRRPAPMCRDPAVPGRADEKRLRINQAGKLQGALIRLPSVTRQVPVGEVNDGLASFTG